MNWSLIGHEWAVAQLQRALANQRVHHAYLFTGPASIGKTTLARAFASALNCSNSDAPCGACRTCRLIARDAHPDVSITEAEQIGGTLKIDQIRELQRNLSLRPYEAAYKVAILRRFHEANPPTQNAILKTLEEPAANVILIMTSDHGDLLLPTITSRCQILNLRPLSLEATLTGLAAYKSEEVDLVARLSAGRLGWAIRTLQDPSELAFRNAAIANLEEILKANKYTGRFQHAETLAKSQLGNIFEYWQTYWRDVMLVASGSQAPITNIDRAEMVYHLAQVIGYDRAFTALQSTRQAAKHLRQNVNTRLCVEVLVMDYPMI